jgi:galactosyl transferase GMA12/MNN10 family
LSTCSAAILSANQSGAFTINREDYKTKIPLSEEALATGPSVLVLTSVTSLPCTTAHATLLYHLALLNMQVGEACTVEERGTRGRAAASGSVARRDALWRHRNFVGVRVSSTIPAESQEILVPGQDYVRVHGYEFWLNTKPLDKGAPGKYWSKISFLLELLETTPAEEVNWFLWIDTDALFLDLGFTIPLHEYAGKDFVLFVDPDSLQKGDVINGRASPVKQRGN